MKHGVISQSAYLRTDLDVLIYYSRTQCKAAFVIGPDAGDLSNKELGHAPNTNLSLMKNVGKLQPGHG
jgi:hypothetical protein